MSIVETYKKDFKIVCYDQDPLRGERLTDLFCDYDFNFFSSRGFFLESLDVDLPHVVLLFYQPLNLKFHELLTKINQVSSEVEVIVLGSNEFWPGIHSLMKNNLIRDFWSWPVADEEVLRLRVNHIIEKSIYRFISEQRSSETAKIIERLESQVKEQMGVPPLSIENSDWLTRPFTTESQAIESFINHLKETKPQSDFVYLKNDLSRSQLLVTRTSFAKENYMRGQSIPVEDSDDLKTVTEGSEFRETVQEIFQCEDFQYHPVAFDNQIYGFIMTFQFEDDIYLKKMIRYLSMRLRNLQLESLSQPAEMDVVLHREVSRSQFPLVLSSEVSRARRLQQPLALIVAHIEYISTQTKERRLVIESIADRLRSYDFYCSMDDQKIAIVLPHCSYENAAIKAEKIRRMVIAKGIRSQNTPLRLCFGVSEFPSLSVDSDALLEDTKQACTQVLVSGKNKVCLASKNKDHEPEYQPKSIELRPVDNSSSAGK